MAQEQDDFEAIPINYKETKPSFNGGDVYVFLKWVNEHKHYPEEAKKARIEGEEAIRVIESAPQKWIPGERKGEPIDVTYTFPVVFKLTDEDRAQVD